VNKEPLVAFLFQTIMTFLRNISTSSEGKRHRSLETFCHRSEMGM